MRVDLITELYGQSMDELSGAITYAKCAAKWKCDNPEASKNYVAMASEELRHASMLRDMASKEIEKSKAENQDSTYICEYHECYLAKFSDEYGHVKQMLSSFSG